MNTNIIDFLRNVSDENVVAAKESINAALAQKVSDALAKRESEIKDSIYAEKTNKEE
jgi:FixJ family two-component response regulator